MNPLAPQCPSKDPDPSHARCVRRVGHPPPHHATLGLGWNDEDPQTEREQK